MSEKIQIDLSLKGILLYIGFLVGMMILAPLVVCVLLYIAGFAGVSAQDIIMKVAGI